MKGKLDLMGRHCDTKSRAPLRTYMRDLVAKARSLIYDRAIPITGVAVEESLKPMSLVPTLVSSPLDHSKVFHPVTTHTLSEFILRTSRQWCKCVTDARC
jgi:hypothetical protein